MAKILRFEEPTSFSPLNYRGLDQIKVFIAEEGGNSYDYFGFTKVPKELTAGRNLLSFTGTQNLVPGAEIAIEVMDANGELIPVRTFDHIGFGNERVFSIEIDEKVPEGDAKITIVSIAKGKVGYNANAQRDVSQLPPPNYRGRFNIRWTKRLNCSPRKRNTSDLTFFPNPDITIEEVKRPYFKLHYNQGLNTYGEEKATGEFQFTSPLSHSQEVRINVQDGFIYRFIAEDAPIIPDDASPVFFFPTGSTAAQGVVNLRDQINSASMGVECQTGSATTILGFTASSAGLPGNSIFIYTASYSTLFSTASLTVPAATMSGYHGQVTSSFIIGHSPSTAISFSLTGSAYADGANNSATTIYIPTGSTAATTTATLISHFNFSQSVTAYTASIGAITASNPSNNLFLQSIAPSGSIGNNYLFISSSTHPDGASSSFFTGGEGLTYGPTTQSLVSQLGGGTETLHSTNTGSEYILVSTGSVVASGIPNTSASFRYEVQGDKYFIFCDNEPDFGGFTDDMIGGTIYFPEPRAVYPSSFAGPYASPQYNELEDGDGGGELDSGSATVQYKNQGAYNTYIIERLSPLQIRVNSPHTTFQGIGRANAKEVFHQKFSYSDFRLDWAQSPISRSNPLATTHNEMNTSYARISFNNLTPLVGDVSRIKTYIRNDQTVNDYFLVGDNPVFSPELLVQSSSKFDRMPAGDFSEFGVSHSFANYWTASTSDGTQTGPVIYPFKSSVSTLANPMPEALQVGDTITAHPGTLNGTNYWVVESTVPMLMQKDKYYEVSFKSFALRHSGSQAPPHLDIYIDGSAVTNTGDVLGKHIGTIQDIDQGELVTEDDIYDQDISKGPKFTFKADATEFGFLKFKVKRGIWWLSNISVKPFDKYGHTPHFFEAIIPTPKANVTTKDALDFRFEFYNIDHKTAAYTSEIRNVEFDNEYVFTATSVFFTSASINTFFGETPIGDNDWSKQGLTSGLYAYERPELTESIYHSGSVGIGDFSTTPVNYPLHIKKGQRQGNAIISVESYSSSILLLRSDVGGAGPASRSAYIQIDQNNSATSSVIGYTDKENQDPRGAVMTGTTQGSFVIHEQHGKVMALGIGGTAPLQLATGMSKTFDSSGYGGVFVGHRNVVPGSFLYELDVSGSEIIRSGSLFLPHSPVTTSAGVDYILGTKGITGHVKKLTAASLMGDRDWFIGANYISQSRIVGTSGYTVWIGDNEDVNTSVAPNTYIFQVSQSGTTPRVQLLGVPAGANVPNILAVDDSGNLYTTNTASVDLDDDWHISTTQVSSSRDVLITGSISASGVLHMGYFPGPVMGRDVSTIEGSLHVGELGAGAAFTSTIAAGAESLYVGSGNHNSNDNIRHIIVGLLNSSSGHASITVGSDNINSGGDQTAILGSANICNGSDYSALIGNSNRMTGTSGQIAMGIGLHSSGSVAGHVVLGRYNKQNFDGRPALIIGGGSSGTPANLAEFHTSHTQLNKDTTITGSLGVGVYPIYKLDINQTDADPVRVRSFTAANGYNLVYNRTTGIIYYDEAAQNMPQGGNMFGDAVGFVSSPGIQIMSGSLQFYSSSVTQSSGLFLTQSALVKFEKDNEDSSFVITGSGTTKVYFSGSGRLGINTNNPQKEVEIVADEMQFRRASDERGVKLNTEGNFESFAALAGDAATGSEFILNFTRGTLDEPVKLNSGDVLGSIRWIQESGSLDSRTSGEAAKIRAVVGTSDATGIDSHLEFMVGNEGGLPERPIETVFSLRADRVHYLTGSLNITSDLSSAGGGSFANVTASVISASTSVTARNIYGQVATAAQTGISSLYKTDMRIGEDAETRLDFSEANKIRWYAGNQLQMQLEDGVLKPASDSDVDLGTTSVRWKDAFIDNMTITNHITASGDISSSGDIILGEGQKIYFNDDGNSTTFIQGVSNNLRLDADDDLLLYPDDDIKIGRGTNDQYAWFYGNADPVEKKFTLSGSINTLAGGIAKGDITASGNISASGTITAPNFTGQIISLDMISCYVSDADDGEWYQGRSQGLETGDWKGLATTTPATPNDEHAVLARVLPVSMSTIGFRGGFRVGGGGNVQVRIYTGSRANWDDASTLTLGIGATGSATAGDGQNIVPLDIPEFTLGSGCDTVHFYVGTSEDSKAIRGTGTLFGRT